MKTLKIFMAMSLVVISLSCGGGGSSSGPKITDANDKFATGDYADALSVYLDLKTPAAKVGAGWCYNRLGDYSNAVTQFAAAAADSLADGYAGWGMALWADSATTSNAQGVVEKVLFVMRNDPDFALSIDNRITLNSLIYLKASSHLVLQQYQLCRDAIRLLPGESGYTPNLAASDIELVLLLKLEDLGAAQ